MPKPSNRGVQPETVNTPESAGTSRGLIPTVRVRARTHIAEEIGGVMTRLSPGQEFETDEVRAAALGALVEVIQSPAKSPAAG